MLAPEERAREMELLSYQIDEIERADFFEANEDELLMNTKNSLMSKASLSHFRRLKRAWMGIRNLAWKKASKTS